MQTVSLMTRCALLGLAGLFMNGCSMLSSQQVIPTQQVKETPAKSLNALTGKHQVQPKLAWSKNLETRHFGNIKLRPSINGSHIIAAGQRSVSAWNLQTGQLSWTETLGQTITAGVSGSNGTTYVGTANGSAIALDSKTGKTRWINLLKNKVIAISEEKNGNVVFRTVNGNIHTLSTANGALAWQASQRTPALSLHGSSTPILAGPYVVTGFDNGSLVSHDIKTGKQVWSIQLGTQSDATELSAIKDIDAELKTIGAILFASSYQGNLVGIDMRTGKVGWSRKFSSYSGIDASKKDLFITEDTGKVWKFNALTGAPVWENDDLLRRKPTAPIITSPNHFVVADSLGYLHWYNRASGKLVGRIQGDRSGYNVAPVKYDNMLYTLSKRGVLSAYTL